MLVPYLRDQTWSLHKYFWPNLHAPPPPPPPPPVHNVQWFAFAFFYSIHYFQWIRRIHLLINGGCVAWETATTFKEGRRRANYPLLARGSIVKNNNTELCRNFVTDGPVDKYTSFGSDNMSVKQPWRIWVNKSHKSNKQAESQHWNQWWHSYWRIYASFGLDELIPG